MLGLKPAADARNIQLIAPVQSPSIAVNADAKRVQQVLTNLLHNAIKFTSDGRVEAWVERLEDEVRVTVPEPNAKARVLLHNPEFTYYFLRSWSRDGKSVLATVNSQGHTAMLAWISLSDGTVKTLSTKWFGFDITPATGVVQAVGTQDRVMWTWQVRPKATGPQTLTLTVRVDAENRVRMRGPAELVFVGELP